jgi:D-cysteine desulfhydrase
VSRRESLRTRLDAHERVPLAEYPTPLVLLPALSRQLGRSVYLKRDDAIGPALGGNKTRKLEYLLADARRRGARKVATFGGLQSNHARLTAAAARLLGMEPHLFYFESRPERLTGNLLLAELVGARLHFLPAGRPSSGLTVEAASRFAHATAWLRIGRHYFIPVGGHNWRGALGYVRAALELDEQIEALGIGPVRVVVAAGSGGTLAGLLAGFALLGSEHEVLGIDVGKLWRGFAPSIARLAAEVTERLGEARPFAPGDVPLVEEMYVGSRYGVASDASLSAIRRLADLEGVLLDPVYTGKAFAGMLDLVSRGQLDERPLVFVHTGGLPALFADGVLPSQPP